MDIQIQGSQTDGNQKGSTETHYNYIIKSQRKGENYESSGESSIVTYKGALTRL